MTVVIIATILLVIVIVILILIGIVVLIILTAVGDAVVMYGWLLTFALLVRS